MVLDVLINILLVAVGLAMLYFGAEWLVRGSVTIANKFRISQLVIGLTIVAFGTSTPELSVSVSSAIEMAHPVEDEWVAGIDLGFSKSLMVIMGHGKFYFSRPLPGIQATADKMADPTFSQSVAAEIQHSMDTFSVTFHVEKINRISVTGGGANLPGLCNYLNENLGIQSELLNPFSQMFIPDTLNESLKGQEHIYSQAAALAKLEV